MRFTTFQKQLWFFKRSDLSNRLNLRKRKQHIVHLSSILFFGALRKKHLKNTDTTVIYISSFQELIDINNFHFLELLTNDDNVLCSVNRARENNSKKIKKKQRKTLQVLHTGVNPNNLVSERLTSGDIVLGSIKRWNLNNLKASREEAVRQWEVFDFCWDSY